MGTTTMEMSKDYTQSTKLGYFIHYKTETVALFGVHQKKRKVCFVIYTTDISITAKWPTQC